MKTRDEDIVTIYCTIVEKENSFNESTRVKQQKQPDTLTNAQISPLVNFLRIFRFDFAYFKGPRRADKYELSCVKIALVCKG